DAGFHVGISYTDPEVVEISFFEYPGIQLTSSMQKEIEKDFTRLELRRAAHNAVGSVSYPARVRETYAQDLLATLDRGAIRERGRADAAAPGAPARLERPAGEAGVPGHGDERGRQDGERNGAGGRPHTGEPRRADPVRRAGRRRLRRGARRRLRLPRVPARL